MNKIVSIMVLLVMFVFFVSGCALFGNEAQYEKGDWYGLSSSREVARIKQDKLALKKLEQQRDLRGADSKNGYKGKVANFSRKTVNIVIRGPEDRAFLLEADQVVEKIHLIPGRYHATAYCEGNKVGSWTFHSDLEKDLFLGEEVYWYLYYDD